MTYNGWSNRETWLVNVHFNPETKEDLEIIKDDICDMEDMIQISSLIEPFLKDYIDLSLINWRELKEAIVQEVKNE